MRERVPEPVLAAARDWALDHLSSPLTVEDLAERAQLRAEVFSRRWHEETGLPPYRWLTLARIERAKDLLERTDMTPADISRTCGFGSASNFRLRFRRETGVDPARYRDRSTGG